MQTINALLAATSLITGGVLADSIRFDSAETGKPPPGWTATKTGNGDAKWTVDQDETAPSKPNVLRQSGVATYPVCIKDDTRVKDGFVEVKFKSVSGKEDQAGGVIWRCADADNFRYVAVTKVHFRSSTALLVVSPSHRPSRHASRAIRPR